MVAVQWADGRVDQEATWEALLARINALPWNRKYTPEEFRIELAARAHVWCGEPVVHPDTTTAEELFAELETAKLLRRVPTE